MDTFVTQLTSRVMFIKVETKEKELLALNVYNIVAIIPSEQGSVICCNGPVCGQKDTMSIEVPHFLEDLMWAVEQGRNYPIVTVP